MNKNLAFDTLNMIDLFESEIEEIKAEKEKQKKKAQKKVKKKSNNK